MKRMIFIGILVSVFALVCIVHTNTVFAQNGEGCTPGFWKQPQSINSWVGWYPDDPFEAVFGVDASGDPTLLDALEARGGGEYALMRHAVAALLNATNPDVYYAYSMDEVIAIVQDAYATGDFEGATIELEYQNDMGCLLIATAPKVTICHIAPQGDYTTMSVKANALPAHLAHGDTIGPCNPD